jgi:cell division protein FtsI (penicillin-binding protein 3)
MSTPFSLAIGHNLQVTSVQLLRAYAILANGGYQVQPTLIKDIVKKQPDGQESVSLFPKNRQRPFPQLLNSSIVDRVVQAMKYVTKKGGKSYRADIPRFTECGKTGTAEKIVQGVYSKSDHIVTFVGFAPVSKPAFVLLVTIDEPEKGYIPGVGKKNMGSYVAAPVFREIGQRALEYLAITPDDPQGYPENDPRYDPRKGDWVQNAEALKKQYDEWNGKK